MQDAAAVFKACYAAYLADDWDSFGRLLADDVVLESPGTPAVRGRDSVLAYHKGVKAGFPDIGGNYSAIVADADLVGGLKTLGGTHTGTIRLSDGREIPPTGRRIEVPESDWMRVSDGRCVHHWIYYDRMLLLQQLGLIPAAPTSTN